MEATDKNVAAVPDVFKKDLEWYIENQKELVRRYDGKILLIVNQKLIGAFDSMEEAYTTALKSYTLGTFTLQPCSPGSDSYTLTLHNPS